jgi:uncharacterized protein YegL
MPRVNNPNRASGVANETPKSSRKKNTPIPTIHIVHILDCSGSMSGSKYNTALSGLNEELNVLKQNNDASYTYTFVEFESTVRKPQYVLSPITDINKVSAIHPTGMTALYDAIGQTLKEIKAKRTNKDEKVLVNIFTDGEENNSRSYNSRDIEKLIKDLESEGFTVTFVGTKGDIANIVRTVGIDISNTMSHDNTVRGIQKVAKSRMEATVLYSKAVANGEEVSRGFYSKVLEEN